MMPYVFGIIILVVVIIATALYLYLIKTTAEKDATIKQQIRETLNKFGSLDENGIFPKFLFNGINYHVMMLKLKPGSKFTFNSKTIWETRFGNSKTFTDNKVFAALPGKKIVIIYPHEGPFMYHYDENEIRFTKFTEKFWDMHVTAFNNLEEVLQKGL